MDEVEASAGDLQAVIPRADDAIRNAVAEVGNASAAQHGQSRAGTAHDAGRNLPRRGGEWRAGNGSREQGFLATGRNQYAAAF